MIIIGDNLKSLAKQYNMCGGADIEPNCIKIRLGDYYHVPNLVDEALIYGNVSQNPSEYFSERKTVGRSLVLRPRDQIITCSAAPVKLPMGYFGLVQTKGTLARLFVQATCNDGQIDPGFSGHVTLEIVNLSPWTIELVRHAEVAQIYVIKCSTEAERPYEGRYAVAALNGPTLPVF